MKQSEIKAMLKGVIDKKTLKRLRPLVDAKSFKRKDGNQLCLHLPAFINIDVDDKFRIDVNDITYSFKNRKVAVTVWKDPAVSAQITVYS